MYVQALCHGLYNVCAKIDDLLYLYVLYEKYSKNGIN